jgi:acetyl-CoA carboxylase carboxyl transferase subunit alpha
MMLEYGIYSVISPEGCASILWKSADKAELAATAMGITANRLSDLGLVDEIIPEPLGGAHRAPLLMADTLHNAIVAKLKELEAVDMDTLLHRRMQRLEAIGSFRDG